MNKAIIAERVLRMVTDQESARTIAGDLIETYSRRRSLSFWLALSQLFLAFSWKPMLGIAAAALVWFVVDTELFFAFARGFLMKHLSALTPFPNRMLVVEASATLSALAAFALVAYGIKDRLWMMSTIYAAIAGALVFSFWVPAMQLISYLALGSMIVIGLSTQEMRRVSGIITASFTVSFFSNILWHFSLHRMTPLGVSRTAIVISAIAGTLVMPVVAAMVCGWVKQHVYVKGVAAG